MDGIHDITDDWSPMVIVTDQGTVMLLVGDMEAIRWRTTASYEEWMEQVDRGYLAARESWSRRLYPQLWSGISERAS